MSKPVLDVIIARYQEDLSWIEPINDLATVYIKDPNTPTKLLLYKQPILLQNSINGREGDTYVKHILKHYPNFPDYTVFMQGRIDDHVASVDDVLSMIRAVSSNKLIAKNMPPYVGLAQMWDVVRDFRDPHYNIPLREAWFSFFAEPPPNNALKVNYSGCFMASREAILFHSKAFYERMNYLLQVDHLWGHIFERLWGVVFDMRTKSVYD